MMGVSSPSVHCVIDFPPVQNYLGLLASQIDPHTIDEMIMCPERTFKVFHLPTVAIAVPHVMRLL